MPFVLDASATLPWCFRDEITAQSIQLLRLAEAGHQIIVPAHWPTEILNGLTRAARRGRLDEPEVDLFLAALPDYNIRVDMRPFPERWNETLPLVRKHRLSAYDAAYLALAIHLSVPLASLDSQLRAAASAEKVSLVV